MLFNSLARPYKQALVELGDDGVEHILKVMSTSPLRIKIEYFRDAFSLREYANVEMIIVGEGVTHHSKIMVYGGTTWQKFGEMLTKELEHMNLDMNVSVRTEHADKAFLPKLWETSAWNQTTISKDAILVQIKEWTKK